MCADRLVLIVLVVKLSKLIADHHVSCVSEHVPHARYTRWPWDGFELSLPDHRVLVRPLQL